MKQKALHALPLVLWMLVILSLTLQPGEVSSSLSGSLVAKLYGIVEFLNVPITLDTFHFLVRKAAHVSEYTMFGLLSFLAIKPYTLQVKQELLLVASMGVTFASVDEFIQTFVANRAGQVVDVFIDSIGIALSIVIILIIKTRNKRRTT